MDVETLKEKAIYHYKCHTECMSKLFEQDEDEALRLLAYLEELGGV